MIRLNIKNPDGSLYGFMDCKDQEAIDAYIAECTAVGSYWTLEGSGCTLEQVDVTAEYLEKNAIEKALKCQQIGQRCIAKIKFLTDQKTLLPPAYDAIFADPTLLKIERLLGLGSLSFAKAALQGLSPLPYLDIYTLEDVSTVVALIDESGLV